MSNDKFIVQDGLTINTIEVFTADGVLIGPSGNTLNASFIHANSAYDQANSANVLAQAAFDYANTIITGSSDSWARDEANAAYNQANTGTVLAQSAFDKANTGSSGSITIITGGQYVDYGWVDETPAPVLFDYGTI